jgi:hypothetical protein
MAWAALQRREWKVHIIKAAKNSLTWLKPIALVAHRIAVSAEDGVAGLIPYQ